MSRFTSKCAEKLKNFVNLWELKASIMSEEDKKSRRENVELQLIDDARKGDTKAFDRLMEMYQEKVFRLAYRMLDNRDDALDVVQDTFYRAYRSLKKFRGDSSFLLYLEKIATNLCISRYRRRKVFMEIESLVGIGNFTNRDDDIDADANRKMLAEAMNSLSPRERAAFVLRMEQNFSTAETAGIMKISQGTVKTLLHRALQKMRRALKDKI